MNEKTKTQKTREVYSLFTPDTKAAQQCYDATMEALLDYDSHRFCFLNTEQLEIEIARTEREFEVARNRARVLFLIILVVALVVTLVSAAAGWRGLAFAAALVAAFAVVRALVVGGAQ